MLELEKAINDLGKNFERSRLGFRRGWWAFNNAEKAYRKACQLRERILQDTLSERGLAICSGSHSEVMEVDNPSAEQLGIYPRDQMRLHFYQSTLREIQYGYEEGYDRTTEVGLFCPKHYPQKPDRIIMPESEYPETYSGVIQQDGKYTLSVNGRDITKLINRGGSDIEPNGERYPGVEVYRYFGIPDMPEKPVLDEVKYGRKF